VQLLPSNVVIFFSLERGQASLATEGRSWGGGPVPEAVVTVLCTPDDGCG